MVTSKAQKILGRETLLLLLFFVIAVEVLAQLLENKFVDGSMGFHPNASDVKISSLAFADDLMIFYDGKPSSLMGINSVLSSFKHLSGLEMNTEKSDVYTAGQDESETEETRAFGFVTAPSLSATWDFLSCTESFENPTILS